MRIEQGPARSMDMDLLLRTEMRGTEQHHDERRVPEHNSCESFHYYFLRGFDGIWIFHLPNCMIPVPALSSITKFPLLRWKADADARFLRNTPSREPGGHEAIVEWLTTIVI